MFDEPISDETRTALKQLCADSDPGRWFWDQENWRWEISLTDLRDNWEPGEDWETGYVSIEALENGESIAYGTLPSIDHQEWAIEFVGTVFECSENPFLVKGTLQEAKRQLDDLLKAATPDFPALEEEVET